MITIERATSPDVQEIKNVLPAGWQDTYSSTREG